MNPEMRRSVTAINSGRAQRSRGPRGGTRINRGSGERRGGGGGGSRGH